MTLQEWMAAVQIELSLSGESVAETEIRIVRDKPVLFGRLLVTGHGWTEWQEIPDFVLFSLPEIAGMMRQAEQEKPKKKRRKK